MPQSGARRCAYAILVISAMVLEGCSLSVAPAPAGAGAPAQPVGQPVGSSLAGSLTAGLPGSGQGAPQAASAGARGADGSGGNGGGFQGGGVTPGGPVGTRLAQAANNLPVPFPYAPGTENGNLGCADVVSHALEEAGVIRRSEHQLAVTGVIGVLQGKGWRSVRPPPFADGDVIAWDPLPGGKHMHVGIIVVENGTPYAVNNSSSKRRPVKVPLSSMNRSVDRVLRAPGGVV